MPTSTDLSPGHFARLLLVALVIVTIALLALQIVDVMLLVFGAKRLPELAEQLKLDMPYFGYGYIKDRAELVPYIPVNFYAFRVMVGVGTLVLCLAAAMISFRKVARIDPALVFRT